MNNNHIISLELARDLYKNGWRKDNDFYYVWRGEFVIEYFNKKCEEGNGAVHAPIAEEILEELPKALKQDDLHLIIELECEELYNVSYINIHTNIAEYSTQDKFLVNALAEMWLKLKNQKML